MACGSSDNNNISRYYNNAIILVIKNARVSPADLWSRPRSCFRCDCRWPIRSPSGSTCPTDFCSCCTRLYRPCRAAFPGGRGTWAPTRWDHCTRHHRRFPSRTWPEDPSNYPNCARPWPVLVVGRRSKTALRPLPAKEKYKINPFKSELAFVFLFFMRYYRGNK